MLAALFWGLRYCHRQYAQRRVYVLTALRAYAALFWGLRYCHRQYAQRRVYVLTALRAYAALSRCTSIMRYRAPK